MPTTTYTAIGSVTLATATASVTFTAPSGYRDFVLVINGNTDESGSDSSIAIRINGDTANNYLWLNMNSNGTGTSSSQSSADSRLFIGRLPGNSETVPGTIITQIQDASATDRHKILLSRGNNTSGIVSAHGGRWASSNAITTIAISRYDFAGNFRSGSTFTLWGIAA